MPDISRGVFQSTLSLRRATSFEASIRPSIGISIHALLAESDWVEGPEMTQEKVISIHALLAESDRGLAEQFALPEDFNPRSPCGERLHQHPGRDPDDDISIHALLAESDAV